jgi:hypothetical protein
MDVASGESFGQSFSLRRKSEMAKVKVEGLWMKVTRMVRLVFRHFDDA